MVRKFHSQDYSRLKRDAQRAGELFTDPVFPPSAASLYRSGENERDIVWKRPKEICDNPKLIVHGVSSSDLNQGSVGNCWFVAACSCLALEKKLWHKVVPSVKEQEWDDAHPDRYAGIFHFHFWRLGEWYDVVVDDWLPTLDGKLVYMRSNDSNEFWSALLEKAYAKLAGSYEALSGGQTGDALVDFTGGVNEYLDIREGGFASDEEKAIELFTKISKSHLAHALISSSIKAATDEEIEGVLECGLIKGHAYCMTDIREVQLSGGMKSMFGHRERLHMVRLRNPWGKKEWNGAWSDDSPEWKRVSAKDKQKLGIKIEDDGDFWMELHDWLTWFTDCSVCRQVNTSLLSLSTTWHETNFHGSWRGKTAGGCVNSRDTFLNNPQYSFRISKDGEELMVSLAQKDTRSERAGSGRGRAASNPQGENFSIGFHIMKVEENRKFRLHALQDKAGAITYTNRLSVFGKFELDTGCYVIIPSTFEPNQERDFFLRVFTTRPNHAKEITKEAPTRGILGYLCCCCIHSPGALVTVYLDGATGLEKQDMTGKGADPYCIVSCGRSKATTPVKSDTLDPNFGAKVVFYPPHPDSTEVKVQVWNHNVLVDRFMGQASVPIPRDGESMRHTVRLSQRGRHSNLDASGTITFRVECSHNLRAT